MNQSTRIIIIGAGVFGLSTACELAKRGFKNVIVLDRHMPPVPDGASVDISRIIRFDYADMMYTKLAKEAYDAWTSPTFPQGLFFKQPFILSTTESSGRSYIDQCLQNLTSISMPWTQLHTTEETKERFSVLTGSLSSPGFYGYCNEQAGWADAGLTISSLRDQCIELGVSFFSGAHGTAMELQHEAQSGKVTGVKTKAGEIIKGDLFVLATGAWTAGLVSMHDSILATGQVLGYIKLTEAEMEYYSRLPIYINFDSGWFCFPPHERTNYLKVAVHGWGYTRSRNENPTDNLAARSSPPTEPRSCRANFAPSEGIERLRKGLEEILPELAGREFDRTAVCWYTDTRTGDFIIDYHPDHKNVFLATGGSGHAFKFLPILGKYTVDAMTRSLPDDLRTKWRFRTHYRNEDAFRGDGSRGGPARREFTQDEKARL